MIKAFCYGLLIPVRLQRRRPIGCVNVMSVAQGMNCRRLRSSSSSIEPALLAQDWADALMALETTNEADNEKAKSYPASTTTRHQVIQATARSIPLLQDASSVPFVCRYRTDIIAPLTTLQMHFLWNLVSKHAALDSLRQKLLSVIVNNNNNNSNNSDDPLLRRRVQTSTNKAELEDLYAPYKPPSKGSILQRIQKEHPKLVQMVDEVWNGSRAAAPNSLEPREELIHLLATKIAAQPGIVQVVQRELAKHCRIQTTLVDDDDDKSSSSQPKDASKYRHYHEFSNRVTHLRDHQVLAIRRGVQQKCLQMSYQIDADKMKGCLLHELRQSSSQRVVLASPWRSLILHHAVPAAWTKQLRRRGTTRLWKERCAMAQERATLVFAQNVRHALLAPPLVVAADKKNSSSFVLALDPGFQAGIKCAVLRPDGSVVQLETVRFVGTNQRESGIAALEGLLATVCQNRVPAKIDNDDDQPVVVVALGNGHGSQEARALVQEAAQRRGIGIDIHLVNEAGASVWSVTQAAKKEFPDEPPAAIAAVSIGRRLQNPLHELVKVPPRSLGLGMYQHDLSEKELDERLHLTSVDVVATVGVDVNSCSLQILQKVPGLVKLAAKVIRMRPLTKRSDLLNVPGLGPKTFENCAAFCRVGSSTDGLDGTLVHPESYELAEWLLEKLQWQLAEPPSATDIPPASEWDTKWDSALTEASEKFDVSRQRALAVLTNLVDSMTQIDPRLRGIEAPTNTTTKAVGSLDGCVLLPPELAELSALESSCPFRGVIGTVRTITDFGAFVDFGAAGNGLLHTSKLGPVTLQSLLIGEQIGVDILSVVDSRVSLALTGLGLEADKPSTVWESKNGGHQRRSLSSSTRPNKKRSRRKAGDEVVKGSVVRGERFGGSSKRRRAT